MSEVLSPLVRSKMITENFVNREILTDRQHDVIKEELTESRNYLQQMNAQHENRVKDIRISYEMKLQQVKSEK